MSIYTTDLQIPPGFNHRKLERPTLPIETAVDFKNRTRTYVIDFSRLKKTIIADSDLFYFYPGEVNGFIMSSVLATQREHEDRAIIGRSMYSDLTSALHEFQYKEAEALYHAGKDTDWTSRTLPSCNGQSIDDYEINQAGRTGEFIMDFVLQQMKVIRELHGDYALSLRDMSWTNLDALIMKVHY